MWRRTVRSATGPRWRILRSSAKSTGAPKPRRRKRRRQPSPSGTTLLEDSVQRAEVEVGVAQLVEPVAQRVDVRLKAVDLLGVVDVRRLLLSDQLAPAADLFADRLLDAFPLRRELAQLAIESGQLAGQFLVRTAVAGGRHHVDRALALARPREDNPNDAVV